jgi:hypothetical protein
VNDHQAIINAYLDDELTESQYRDLEAWIRSAPDHRKHFVTECYLHSHLQDIFLGERAARDVSDSDPCDGEAVSLFCPADAFSIHSNAGPRSPVIGLAAPLGDSPGHFFSGWPVAYLIATAIFAVGLVIGALVHVSQPLQLVAPSSPFGTSNPQSPIPNPSCIVGRITGVVDCVLSNDECRMLNVELQTQKPDIHHSSIITQHSPIRLGDRIALKSGLLEITYDSGAKVLLQGPVTYEVESPVGGYLSLGKLTARLEKGSSIRQNANPKRQRGTGGEDDFSGSANPLTSDFFAVRTPTATVTDLGTEFGVEVSSDGTTHTQVFAGEVQIAKRDRQDGSNPQTSRLRTGQSAHVGKNVTVSSDRCEFDVRAKRFVRVIPGGLRTNDAYADLVLSMDPVVYYRMDRWTKTDTNDHCVLIDSAPGAHHGVLRLDGAFGQQASRGRFGKAISLHGRAATDYAFVKSYPKTETGQLAVSAWVWAFSVDAWRAIVGNWYYSAGQSPNVGQFSFGLGQFQQLEAGIWQPDGKPVTVSEHGKILPRSQWQHVAFVADGAVLHLYRNGVEVDTAPYNGISRPAFPQCLSIGCHMDKDAVAPRQGDGFVWDGQLDEIAIFNHAITGEQVRQLSAGQPAVANGKNSR